MTKTARVVSIIFLISISFVFIFTFQVYAGFDELLKPISEDPQSVINNVTMEQLNNYSPSVTFGDLLDNYDSSPRAENAPQVTSDSDQIAGKTAQFKKLLAQLEDSYQTSLADFQAKQETLPRDIPYVLDHPSPTPFIPIPTLLASVGELANINLTTSRSATTYPTPTLTDTLLLASLNNPQPTSYFPPNLSNLPNLSNTGTLKENPIKTTYTIALLGDSMTDTLGKSLPQLRGLLENAYTNYSFALLNYGQGATDLDSGLLRLTNSTNYLGADYPPLLSYKPDILVIESFAYNHWSGEKYDLDRQWLTIAKIIDTVREKSPDTKIILGTTVAPNKYIFGDGALNWPSYLKEQSSLIIKAYLQNLVNFATSQHYPLADAYHPSLGLNGQGNTTYINAGDNLHPSNEGAYLYSLKILETIKANNLISSD